MNKLYLWLFLCLLPGVGLAQAIDDPFAARKTKAEKPYLQPAETSPSSKFRSIPHRIDQVWRLPNGYEEYYMLLALTTADKKWCDRISMEAQIRKVDARPGVQIIPWRNICLIEVASASGNKSYCQFVRGTYVDALDGREFDQNYCVSMLGRGYQNSSIHWLQSNPFKPTFINAQALLKFLGFVDEDLISKMQQGLYQTVTKATWDEFLLYRMLNKYKRKPEDAPKFERLINRSVYLPDFSTSGQPADRFLRYTGTAVKLPADCYENANSELTCRMLECLNVRDIVACRALAQSKEVLDLRSLFLSKCDSAGGAQDMGPAQECKQQIENIYQKIFAGPPENFLPYLNTRR